MEIMSTISSWLDKIPTLIGNVRTLLAKLLEVLNLPADANTFIYLIIALLAAYLFLKQFIVSGLWAKISTILNFILLAIIFYLTMVYV